MIKFIGCFTAAVLLFSVLFSSSSAEAAYKSYKYEDNPDKCKADIMSCLQDNLDATYSLDSVAEAFSFKFNGITINCDEGVSVSRLYEYMEEFASLRESFTEQVWEITFSNENLNDVVTGIDFSKYGDDSVGYIIAGYASGHTMHVNAKVDEGDTLIHELAHIYDKYNDGISKQDEVIEIYEKEKPLIGEAEYKAVSAAEFFAIATDLYFRNNDYVKDNMPETYQLLYNLYENS